MKSSNSASLSRYFLTHEQWFYRLIGEELARYIHINSTNPILWDDGPEREQLDKAGIEVATDGMEFVL